ncbi:MAG: TRAP transporter substrate-binding protein DctP [Desulfobacter sp.]
MLKSMKPAAFICALMLSLTLASTGFAKPQQIKYLHSSPLTAVETASEGMAVSAYLGSLTFLMNEHSKLKGKYSLKYVGNVFTSPNDCLTAVATGGGHLTYTAPPFLEQFNPAWKLLTAPGLFTDFEHFLRAMDTPVWKKQIKQLSEKQGVTVVKWMASIGDFYLFTSKGPITSLDDIKRQKIRYNGAQGYAAALKDANITGIALPYTEVVSSLQTHMINGLLSEIFAQDYYDLPRYTKYLVPISWGIVPMAIVANTKWWDGLPPEERAVFEQSFSLPDAYAYFEALQARQLEAWDKDPKTELVKLPPEEEQKWRDSLSSSTAKFSKSLPPELMEAIKAAE